MTRSKLIDGLAIHALNDQEAKQSGNWTKNYPNRHTAKHGHFMEAENATV
jgi:hypothetical protein